VFLVQQAQPITPVIVKIVEQPAKEISVADVLLGSVGITGLFLAGAAVLGVVLGGAFILVRKWQASRGADGPVENAFHLTRPPTSNPGSTDRD
jgi:hypothetical protein